MVTHFIIIISVPVPPFNDAHVKINGRGLTLGKFLLKYVIKLEPIKMVIPICHILLEFHK
jgi:hypothetical protein